LTEDREIIELFFRRSEAAIEELDRKYGSRCRSLSYGIVNDRQDAEDCVNDAYLGMWNAIPPAKPAPLLPYLYKIVRNLSLKAYYRKRAARRGGAYTVAMEELEACLAAPCTVESEIDARELARIIESFLETLSAENRVIFLRRYWFDDSCREIASRTGLTEKNVTVRLTRIRRKLKEYLEEREVFL
jgi:RNA polymerase sigma factor (sigma-70 family)